MVGRVVDLNAIKTVTSQRLLDTYFMKGNCYEMIIVILLLLFCVGVERESCDSIHNVIAAELSVFNVLIVLIMSHMKVLMACKWSKLCAFW